MLVIAHRLSTVKNCDYIYKIENGEIIESGITDVFEKKAIWNLVEEKFDTIPIIGLYVTVEHPSKDLFYTVNLAVSKNKYGKREICELENIIKSFKMN